MKKKLNTSFMTYSAKSIASFIREAMTRMTPGEISNHVKGYVYHDNFGIVTRPKYTGFEKVISRDVETRKHLREVLEALDIDDVTSESETASYNIKSYLENSTTEESFRESLCEIAEHYADPDNVNLVYYSGGMDSEVVLISFMEAQVEFCPIVFTLTWGADVINEHDLEWAHKFLSEHSIPYISRTLDISEFWESDLIEAYARDWGVHSPQILTQYRMIDIVHSEIERLGAEKFLASRINR
jgi:hypothetical protein